MAVTLLVFYRRTASQVAGRIEFSCRPVGVGDVLASIDTCISSRLTGTAVPCTVNANIAFGMAKTTTFGTANAALLHGKHYTLHGKSIFLCMANSFATLFLRDRPPKRTHPTVFAVCSGGLHGSNADICTHTFFIYRSIVGFPLTRTSAATRGCGAKTAPLRAAIIAPCSGSATTRSTPSGRWVDGPGQKTTLDDFSISQHQVSNKTNQPASYRGRERTTPVTTAYPEDR